MRKAILQNDVIDVIYDSFGAYSLDEAYEILENHRVGKYIPIAWIEKKLNCCDNINAEIFVKSLIRDWRKENGRS